MNPDKHILEINDKSYLEDIKEQINDFSLKEYDVSADFSDLSNIPLAYTATENEQHQIQMVMDLLTSKPVIRCYIDSIEVESENVDYASLQDCAKNIHWMLDFETLIRPIYNIDDNTECTK
jgi:hypothetical protein